MIGDHDNEETADQGSGAEAQHGASFVRMK